MIYRYSEQRGLGFYINRFVDERCVARLKRRARRFQAERDGRKLAIFANEHIGININQYGCYDRLMLDLLFGFLAPLAPVLKSGIALDIGGNVGNHALYFSRHVAHVHSFEPNPRTFDLLRFNAAAVDNITAWNFGLGEADSELELHENPENMGASSIVLGAGAGRPKVKVAVKRLDDVAAGFAQVDLMKIDVEGFEPYVLRGAAATIARHQPLILLEQHASEFRDGSTESLELLKTHGYQFCWPESSAEHKGLLGRRLNTLATMFLGRTYDYLVVAATTVPRRTYPMLIAVPPRFQQTLDLR